MPHEIWEVLMLVALLLLPLDVGLRRVHLSREQIEQARVWVQSKLRRPVPLGAEAEAAVSLASLKEARSRVRLSDAHGDVTEAAAAPSPLLIEPTRRNATPGDGAQATVSQATQRPDAAANPPAPAPAEEAQPLASRLLDARKKRRG